MLKQIDFYKNIFGDFPYVQNYICVGNDIDEFGILKKNASAYIFQDSENKDIGYKVYKSFQNGKCDNIRDAFLIQNLYKYGKNIYGIDFPYGVITNDNRIVGQVIPYYDESCEISNFEQINGNPYSLLLDAYYLIKELYDHGIFYMDIHEHNFVITPKEIKLIDFDCDFIQFKSRFATFNDYYEKTILCNFKYMVSCILRNRADLTGLSRIDTIEDLYTELLNIENQHIKTKKYLKTF